MPTPTPQPTPGELAILRVLWRRGRGTVREVLDDLNAGRAHKPAGYTTVLKLMQIMAERGMVRRDESRRSHVYHAVATEQKTQRRLVSDLLERVFGGSARALVQQALSVTAASPEEVREIRKLLDTFDTSRPPDAARPIKHPKDPGTSKGGSR